MVSHSTESAAELVVRLERSSADRSIRDTLTPHQYVCPHGDRWASLNPLAHPRPHLPSFFTTIDQDFKHYPLTSANVTGAAEKSRW